MKPDIHTTLPPSLAPSFPPSTPGMAYMMIAGLPPILGLYTAQIAPFFFALLGTSQQLSVGPAALCSIYMPTALTALGMDTSLRGAEDLAARAAAASVCAFWVGVLFLLMAFFRLGNLIRFMSHSVMTGSLSRSPSFPPSLPPSFIWAPDILYPCLNS